RPVRLRARAGAAAPAVGRGGRVGRPQRRLSRARGRVSRDRPVPLPAEARAAAPWARRRQSGSARLGARLGAAAVERPPPPPRLDGAVAADAGLARPEPGGAAARDRLPAERVAPARDDRPAERPGGRRGPGTGITAGCARRRLRSEEAGGLEGLGAGAV